jgi:hypothetical protein
MHGPGECDADGAVCDLSPPFASIKMANEIRKLRMADTYQRFTAQQ